MRFGVRVVLCLLALSLAAGLGCRKPLTPNIDRNEAPETWITAAPLDTLTVRDNYLRPIGRPSPTTIPVRFHLYWAGSDRDGAVAGFYYAVVETTAAPTDAGFAQLPGPKPGQYRFTTKTDTTFVFTVSELLTDRQHAFFIYAVDNQGKPDPTPARFIFNAIDKFPPRAIIESAVGTGTIVRLTPDGDPLPPELHQYPVTDVSSRFAARDTVPANSQMDFRWHGEITQAGTYVAGYRYRLEEPEFVSGDSSVHAATYPKGTSPIAPGLKIFTLRALDQAGGGVDSTRRFIVNFDPDTWWAGPDPAAFTGPSDGEYDSHSADITSWPTQNNPVFTTNPPLPPGSTFGPDSLSYRPSRRLPPNRDFTRPGTFYEIYHGRLYARTEGDTVHMNSTIVLWNGGYDKDSRYVIQADRDSAGPTDPTLQGPTDPAKPRNPLTGAVLDDAGQAGSPIGFRALIVPRLTPAGVVGVATQTWTYPVWSPSSVRRSPAMGGYRRMFQAGKFYALARAEDADGGLDQSVSDPVTLADHLPGSPLRRKVLVFYVDKAPALIRDGLFLPSPGQSIDTAQWDFFLRGMDLDPYDPTVEGTTSAVIRFKITLFGKNLDGRDTSWTYIEKSANSTTGQPYILRGTDVAVSFIPGGTMASNPFASGPILVSIQICDCKDCEDTPGAGRCVEGVEPAYLGYPSNPADHVVNPQNVITVNYTRPAGAPGLAPTSSTAGRPGPDSSGRRD
jgi:hypothetical protein